MPRAATKRLVAGRGRYLDDISMKGEYYAAFLRSPYPHASFAVTDTAGAAAHSGVVRVLTADDIDEVCSSWKCVLRNAPDLVSPEQRALARDRTVFQGEPVAMVIARSRAIAEDALELISVDWSELPAVTSLETAASDPGVRTHPHLENNLCWTFQQRARGLQVMAQLVHLGAGLGIFGAHFFHQAAQLSDLILQITNRAGSFTGRGRRRGRFLGAAQCTEAPCAA